MRGEFMSIKSCENLFCIYWEENKCILSNISLDVQGNCQDCIYVDLQKMTLAEARKQMRKKLESAYRDCNEKDSLSI